MDDAVKRQRLERHRHIRQAFADVFRSFAERQNIYFSQVGRRLGLTKMASSQLARGTKGPSLETLIRFRYAYGFDVNAFCDKVAEELGFSGQEKP